MANPYRTLHREDTKLYKALASVFERRFDLSESQKNELIRECFLAAKTHREEQCLSGQQQEREAVEKRENEWKQAGFTTIVRRRKKI